MITPCTSRKAGFRSVRKSPFAKNYLPSAVDTLSRSAEAGLDVVFYVGYDVGDKFWVQIHGGGHGYWNYHSWNSGGAHSRLQVTYMGTLN